MPNPRNDKRNYNIIELLIAGKKVSDISKRYGISEQRIYQIAKFYKLDLSKRRKP
jgi:Mor family transcriptional regulator